MAAGIVVALAGAGAQAVVIVSDGFSYPDGPLVGNSGGSAGAGSSWSGTWSGAHSVSTQQANADTQSNVASRTFSTTFGGSSTDPLYFSGRFTKTGTDTGYALWLRVDDVDTGANQGAQIGLANDQFSARLNGGPGIGGDFGSYTLGQQVLVVGKLEFNVVGSSERLQIWVDPVAEETAALTSTPITTDLGWTAPSSTHLRNWSGAGGSFLVDDLRIGTTWADVGPAGPPPKPSDVVQVDLGRTSVAPPAGWNRVDTGGSIASLLDPSGVPTDLSLELTNSFGWTTSQGPNQSVTAPNGVVFPAGTVIEFAGDNLAAPRDGLAVVRLSSPTKYEYTLTLLSANTHGSTVDTLANIGGTWDPAGMTFLGGQTVTLQTGQYDTAIMTAPAIWDMAAGAYVLDLQIGNPVGGSSVAGLNGLHIQTTVIPEPSTLALAALGLLSISFCGRRRRRRG
jgi:hypothetical protein